MSSKAPSASKLRPTKVTGQLHLCFLTCSRCSKQSSTPYTCVVNPPPQQTTSEKPPPKMAPGTSKVWVAKHIRERDNYKRALDQVQHVAPNSSVLPTNLSEWIVQRLAFLDQNVADGERRISHAESTGGARTGGCSEEKAKLEPAFDGKKFNDGRSVVLAMQSIWAPSSHIEPARSHALWPTVPELKHNGVYRAMSGYHRILPHPRMEANPPVGWKERPRIPPFPFDDISQYRNECNVEKISDEEMFLGLELLEEVDR